jgi:hypothetical protein
LLNSIVGSLTDGSASSARRSASSRARIWPNMAQLEARPAVRFINDILLSAPSIVVGLFIYEI